MSGSNDKNSVSSPSPAPSPQRVYLITGATGSLGTELTKTLLAQGHKVRAFARNEHGHEKLINAVPVDQRPRLTSCIGAVEDLQRLKTAIRGCDYVIHAAAQKSIPLAENNPRECAYTNIVGTFNVIQACLDEKVSRAVFVSTDKASAPATLYGFTKATAERAWLDANRYSAGQPPYFVAVRYGNVFASQGSVVHVWKKQATASNPIEITDPKATRFHITLTQAVALVLSALVNAEPGELWIPKLPTYRLGDFSNAFRQAYELHQQPLIIGLRPAEKLHESMISMDEWPSLKSDESNHFILEPGIVHRTERREYSSGSTDFLKRGLGVEALTEEIRAWASL